MSAKRVPRHLPAIAVGAAAFLAYAVTLANGLVWDDLFLMDFIRTRMGEGGLPRLLAAEFVVDGPTGYYRPLPVLSLWIDSLLSPSAPLLFHLTNVVLHAVNAVLVFLLLRCLLAVETPALIGALFFAVNPIHVEPVAFVSGRTDLWAGTFLLLATLVWAKSRRAEGPPRRSDVLKSSVALTLAALSKELSFLLPAVLLAWDAVAPMEEGTSKPGWWTRNRAWIVGWSVACAAVLLVRWTVVGTTMELRWLRGGGAQQGAWAGSGLAVPIMAIYLKSLLLPWPLKPHYTPSQLSLTLLNAGASLLLLSAFLAAAGRASRRIGLIALIWTIGFLLPVSGLVPVSGQPVAERYLYVPSIGVALLVAGALSRFRSYGRAATAASAGILALCSLGSVAGALVWKDEVTLLQSMVRSSSGSATGHIHLAQSLAAAGRLAEAEAEYREATRLDPGNSSSWHLLGDTLNSLKRPREAIAAYERAIDANPGAVDSYNNLAFTIGEQGDYRTAIGIFTKAIRIRPEQPGLHLNRGVAAMRIGSYREALASFEGTLRLEPNNPQARYNAGVAHLMLGERTEAEAHYRILARLDVALAGDLLARLRRR